jgi:hypothetical protein
LIKAANLVAEDALWRSHVSVLTFVLRLYDHLFLRVVCELSRAISKIHVSFDGWTTKGGKKSFLGIVAHYVLASGELQDLPIALPQLTGAHTSEWMAKVVVATLQKFEIAPHNVSYFVLDNASNNDSTIATVARQLEFNFNPVYRRLRCGPHTLNLIGQVLLWGKKAEAFNNNQATSNIVEETKLMKDWRRDSLLGVHLGVINYINTLQQYALFENFQRLAQSDLPAKNQRIYEPVKPVVTRWNSYYSCFERAVELQAAVSAYANSHIDRIKIEDAYARSRGNKLPDAPHWMRSDGLRAADWQVVSEYIDVLGPLKECTKRLEGRGHGDGKAMGRFGSIAEIIPVFEHLLGELESQL